ncbi:hypothetical protein [Solihabitans fulvus]|uniref:hypothetical protein n=1 Tax=Solihabitans fulvus TaxID=1892852 RepID=UPI0016620DE3|nr:hypothetical protein [Solihabitans fulvus]
MSRQLLVPVLGVALLALAGCAGGGPSPQPVTAASESASAAALPPHPYQGQALPRLAGQPAWGLDPTVDSNAHSIPVWAVGDSFVFHTGRSGSHAYTFRAAATGQVVGTVPDPLDSGSTTFATPASTGEYLGKPVLYLRGGKTTKGDGLSPDTVVDSYDGYDAHGVAVVHTDRPKVAHYADSLLWQNGFWTQRTDAQEIVFDAKGQQLFGAPTKNSREQGLDFTPTIVGGFAILGQDQSGGGVDVDVYDLSKPTAPAWRAGTVAPAGLTAAAGLVGVFDHKVVLGWRPGGTDAFGLEPVQFTVHDLATGRVLATTPVVHNWPTSTLSWPRPDNPTYDRTTGALTFSGSNAKHVPVAMTFDLKTGQPLWQQGEQDAVFKPRIAVAGACYGSASGSNATAVDANGKVLDHDLRTSPVAVSDDGYALVTETEAALHGLAADAWVFKGQPS